MKELKGMARSLGTAEEVPPGGASDSHRHTFKSLLENPYLGAMPFASFPAGTAPNMNGKFGFDTTNNRLVWYQGATRYASAAGAVV
jgi:hypothetical protein